MSNIPDEFYESTIPEEGRNEHHLGQVANTSLKALDFKKGVIKDH